MSNDNIRNLVDESRKFMLDNVFEHKKNVGTKDQLYWQGRKDSSRLMYALIMDNTSSEEGGDTYRFLVESSYDSKAFDWEVANELLADAVYNVSAMLDEMDEFGKVDVRTKMNLKEFVNQYDYLAKKGKFPVIDDHC